MIKQVTKDMIPAYEAFVQSHPKGHFCQSVLWAKQKPMWKWEAVVSTDDDGNIRGSLAMLAFGCETVRQRIRLVRSGRAPFRDMAPRHPYAAAAVLADETGALRAENGRFRPDAPVTAQELRRFFEVRLGRSWEDIPSQITHGQFFLLADRLLSTRQ